MGGEGFGTGLWAWIVFAMLLVPVLLRVSAPYGRHARSNWGPTLPSWLGWVLMEAPSPLLMLLCFVQGQRHDDPVAIALLGLWLLHYVNRAFVFPFRMRGGHKPMPVLVACMAFSFNLVNGWTNGRRLFALGPVRGTAWLTDPRFLVGATLFVVGFVVNLRADAILRSLRAPGETGYRVPHGFLYDYVSCPNYLGEILEWCGFALAAWSLPALAFATWTVANLAPRALSHHRWYQATFSDYPAKRRALVPFLF